MWESPAFEKRLVFAPASLGYRASQVRVGEAGEIVEGRLGSELFAHEEHRQVRRAQQDRRRKLLLLGCKHRGEARTGVRIRYLVVILIEHDELPAGIRRGRSAVAALTIGRPAAVVDESLHYRLAQIFEPAKVSEVAMPRTDQQGMQRMVKVVVPLGIDPVTAKRGRIDDAWIIQVAFGN